MQQQQQFPNFYGSVPMQQQQQQQYPGGPLYPQIPPPYGDPSKEQLQANPPPPPMNPNQPPPPYQFSQQQQQHLQYMPMFPGQQVYAYPGGYNPYQPYQYQMMVQQLPPNMAVVMPDGFDASARFDGVARASVPVSSTLCCLGFSNILSNFPATTTGRSAKHGPDGDALRPGQPGDHRPEEGQVLVNT